MLATTRQGNASDLSTNIFAIMCYQAHPFPKDCPTVVDGMDPADDLELYDEVSEQSTVESPIVREAAAASALPPVGL